MTKKIDIFKQIKNQIDQSDRILLHLHPSPDQDSAGSALAFFHYLRSQNKSVTLISGDSQLPDYLKILPGSENIINKNYLQLDLSQYDLFIILDTSAPNQISKISEVVFPKTLKTIVVDHHSSNTNFADINLVDKKSPATAQIVYQLLKYFKADITKEISICLYLGMYGDTGGFKYSNTSFLTYQIATNLVKKVPDFYEYIFKIENSNSPSLLVARGLALTNIKNFLNNHVAISTITNKNLRSYRLKNEEFSTGDIANLLKSVVGWDIGICLIETEPKVCKVSFRTRDSDKYDVSLIAQKAGIGGGHKAAAGTTIYKSPNAAIKHLVATISEIYPDLLT
ncbi:MAG: bifunctional oligoribonuclease/PAP phosphatase NrnA [Patescibacteria group bacterium]